MHLEVHMLSSPEVSSRAMGTTQRSMSSSSAQELSVNLNQNLILNSKKTTLQRTLTKKLFSLDSQSCGSNPKTRIKLTVLPSREKIKKAKLKMEVDTSHKKSKLISMLLERHHSNSKLISV